MHKITASVSVYSNCQPLHASSTDGVPNAKAVVSALHVRSDSSEIVEFGKDVNTGATSSVTSTSWECTMLFPEQSTASHVRMKVVTQADVTVSSANVTSTTSQLSMALSKAAAGMEQTGGRAKGASSARKAAA